MSNRIKLFPYMATPTGIEVCFTRNGGAIEQKRFPAETSRDQILAMLAGNSIPGADLSAEQKKRFAEEQKQRAAASQPSETQSEDDLKNRDIQKDGKIAELNMMRSLLKAAHVRGYQLFGEERIRSEYAKLQQNKEA